MLSVAYKLSWLLPRFFNIKMNSSLQLQALPSYKVLLLLQVCS